MEQGKSAEKFAKWIAQGLDASEYPILQMLILEMGVVQTVCHLVVSSMEEVFASD